MAKTKSYRDQHDKILESLVELEKMVASGKYTGTVMAIARLAGKVKVHLAVEDKSLYPSLVGHTDKSVSDMAKNFQKEMGQLAGVFVAWVEKWNSDIIIEKSAADFKKETTVVIKALRDRIDRENNQLYATYDKVG